MDYAAFFWATGLTISVITICITKIEIERIRNK